MRPPSFSMAGYLYSSKRSAAFQPITVLNSDRGVIVVCARLFILGKMPHAAEFSPGRKHAHRTTGYSQRVIGPLLAPRRSCASASRARSFGTIGRLQVILVRATPATDACDTLLLGAFACARRMLIAVFLPSVVLPLFVLSPGAAAIERAGQRVRSLRDAEQPGCKPHYSLQHPQTGPCRIRDGKHQICDGVLITSKRWIIAPSVRFTTIRGNIFAHSNAS